MNAKQKDIIKTLVNAVRITSEYGRHLQIVGMTESGRDHILPNDGPELLDCADKLLWVIGELVAMDGEIQVNMSPLSKNAKCSHGLLDKDVMVDGDGNLWSRMMGKDVPDAETDFISNTLKTLESLKDAPRSIKEQFLALGEKAIKRIDFGKVADAEWEICSDSRERMFSWARGAIEGAVSKVIAGGEEAEFACGCLDAKASRKHGRLRIELNHRRTKQYVEVEEEEETK